MPEKERDTLGWRHVLPVCPLTGRFWSSEPDVLPSRPLPSWHWFQVRYDTNYSMLCYTTRLRPAHLQPSAVWTRVHRCCYLALVQLDRDGIHQTLNCYYQIIKTGSTKTGSISPFALPQAHPHHINMNIYTLLVPFCALIVLRYSFSAQI